MKVYDRDWMTKEEAEAFVGENAPFYLDKWKSHAETGLKGWNWAAGFFSIEWMAYRKMYAEAVVYFMGMFLAAGSIGLLLSLLHIHFDVRILRDAFRIVMGILGNMLYRKKALRVLKGSMALDDAQRLLTLRAKGGVSVLSVVVCIAIEFALGALLALV